MLDESYYDGSRLQKYLAILAQFREEENLKALRDVGKDDTSVIAVEYDNVSDSVSLSDVLAIDDRDVETTVSIVADKEIEVVMSVCENEGQVSGHMTNWTKYLVQEYESERVVHLRNGHWSKEIRCSRLGIMALGNRYGVNRQRNQSVLRLVHQNSAWLREACENLFRRNQYIRHENHMSYDDYVSHKPWDYLYVKYGIEESSNRVMVGVKDKQLSVMDKFGVTRIGIGTVLCPDFIVEGFCCGRRIKIIDVYQIDGKEVEDDFDYRFLKIMIIINESKRSGRDFFELAPICTYMTFRMSADFNVLFFLKKGKIKNLRLNVAYQARKDGFVFRVLEISDELPYLQLCYKGKADIWISVECSNLDQQYKDKNVVCEQICDVYRIIGIASPKESLFTYRRMEKVYSGISVAEMKMINKV